MTRAATVVVGFLLGLASLLGPAPVAAQEAPERCWLVREIVQGGFTLKFFLTDRHRETVKTENLAADHPGGWYGTSLELSEATRRNLFLGRAGGLYMEVWRDGGLVYVLNDSGVFEQFSGFERLLMKQAGYPKKGCTTHALYYNTGQSAVLRGRNLMLTVCPDEERLTAFATDCPYDILYERVTGGYPDDEFDRLERRADLPAFRQICDPGLKGYGQKDSGGLPTPVRLLVFDAKENKWRADHPGELPGFYFFQIPITLDYSGIELQSGPPADLSPTEAQKSASGLMSEILANKTAFIKKTKRDLALVAYCLIMMGAPEKEVREFFLTMAAEYSKVRGSWDWSREKPSKVFADIVQAAKSFQPLERDSGYPKKQGGK